jgi:hypothetical protein
MDDTEKKPEENTEVQKQEPPPVPAKPRKEKKVVAKKAARAKGGKKKKAASANGASKRAGRAPRIPDDAKIMKTGKNNPFREGSESYDRVESVLKLSGQTVATIKKKVELKTTTLSNMVKLGLIRAD